MLSIVASILGAGFFGGFINALLAGELKLPYTDAEARVYHPGWLGNVAIGGVTALILWGLYGPLAAAVVLGGTSQSDPAAVMRLSELCGAIVSGIGGGRLLTAEVEKRQLRREKEALDTTKQLLTASMDQLNSRLEQ